VARADLLLAEVCRLRGDHQGALEYGRRAVDRLRTTDSGTRAELGGALNSAGSYALSAGAREEARRNLVEALEVTSDDVPSIAVYALANLAVADYLEGDHEQAAVGFADALAYFHATGLRIMVPELMTAIAASLGERSEPQAAARILGAADALFATFEEPQNAGAASIFADAIASLRADDALAGALEAGTRLAEQAAVDEAFACVHGMAAARSTTI
jgi:hypothetical protein